MSDQGGRERAAFLEIPGDAADHLYREGSAKASFWEAVFGSSLRAKRRTDVSSLPDGVRRFDVPLLEIEDRLLDDARAWLGAPDRPDSCREAAVALLSGSIRARLIGLQPRGQALASFALRFESAAAPSAEVVEAFRSWFEDARKHLTRDILVPFGFTPHPPAAREAAP